MKTVFKVTEIDKEDLVNLLDWACLGNGCIGLDYDYDEWKKLGERAECVEEKCAELLLAGKSIILADFEAEGEVYGDPRRAKPVDDDKWGYDGVVVEYSVTLKDIIAAMESEEGAYHTNRIIQETGDMYDAWNILQIAMFGEVIYG